LRIDARLFRKHERFRHARDIDGDDDLIRQFRRIARADAAAVHRALAHLQENAILRRVEICKKNLTTVHSCGNSM
jgi:hypothetical protein